REARPILPRVRVSPPPLARRSLPGSSFGFLLRWLPELDLVAVRIDEPAKAALFVLFDLADHLIATEMNLTERAVEIVDDEIEHELALRRREVIGVDRKRAPNRERPCRQRVGGEF